MSQLRLAIGTQPVSQALPPHLQEDLHFQAEPESLLGVRTRKGSTDSQQEVLIQWKATPVTEATWEDACTIKNLFPEFHLEDKVAFWERSVAKPPLRYIYSRRGKKGN